MDNRCNTLINEFGDRVFIETVSRCRALRTNGEYDYFNHVDTAKIWLDSFRKAKEWIQSND